MSGKYISGTQQIMQGQIDLVTDTIVIYLVDDNYVPDYGTHNSLANIPEEYVLSQNTLEGNYLDATSLKAVDSLFQGVEIDKVMSKVVLCTNGTTRDNSLLIAAFDVGDVVANGEDVTIHWDASGLMGY